MLAGQFRKEYMTIKELEKEIREKITVLDMDELKKVIKFIDQLQEEDLLWANDTINNLKKTQASSFKHQAAGSRRDPEILKRK